MDSRRGWVYGAGGSGDRSDYEGIASALRVPGSARTHGWVHQEAITDAGHIASIGQVFSDDEGYTWNDQGTILTGDQLQSSGFRGAAGPSVARKDNELVMIYGNRYGDGRHEQLHLATAAVNRDGSPGNWQKRGQVISESERDPHYYESAPSLRWSTKWRRWVCMYSTDSAYRIRTSKDLKSWSSASTVLTKESQWQQTSGWWRWFPTLLDSKQVDSSIIGSSGWVSEQWINVENSNERYPAWMSFKA